MYPTLSHLSREGGSDCKCVVGGMTDLRDSFFSAALRISPDDSDNIYCVEELDPVGAGHHPTKQGMEIHGRGSRLPEASLHSQQESV